MLGVPIPANSIGSLIFELIESLPINQQLYALHYNGRRLIEKITNALGGLDAGLVQTREFYVQFQEAAELHKQFLRQQRSDDDGVPVMHSIQLKRARLLYISSAREISAHLATNFVNYDHLYIGLGLFWTSIVSVQQYNIRHRDA